MRKNRPESARILKYLKLLNSIVSDSDHYKKAAEARDPALTCYRVIAFLRGCMLANVAEHSFRSIHKMLDPDFRVFQRKYHDSLLPPAGSEGQA